MTAAESTAATSSLVPGTAFEALNEAEARRIAGRGAEIARSWIAFGVEDYRFGLLT